MFRTNLNGTFPSSIKQRDNISWNLMGNPQLKLNEVVIREELVRFCDESADAVADDAALADDGA